MQKTEKKKSFFFVFLAAFTRKCCVSSIIPFGENHYAAKGHYQRRHKTFSIKALPLSLTAFPLLFEKDKLKGRFRSLKSEEGKRKRELLQVGTAIRTKVVFAKQLSLLLFFFFFFFLFWRICHISKKINRFNAKNSILSKIGIISLANCIFH